MKRISLTRFGIITSMASLIVLPASVVALQTSNKAAASTNSTARLQLIISHGNSEINRRLATLKTLSSQIASAEKLSAADKASLTAEVTTETTNLTALETKLDADTTVSAAQADAQSIITDYRVYALIWPKVELVRTADAQLATEAKLTTLAGKLQNRLGSSPSSSQQSALSDMNNKLSAAQTISSSIESKVINLQPSDYNGDHKVLSGDRDQLKTADSDIKAAITDAKTIIASLKS